MQTKLLAGQYLVNGTKCELSIYSDSICWYPVRKFPKSNSIASSTTTTISGDIEAKSKRIPLKQVIGIKNFHFTSVEKLKLSNKYGKKKDKESVSTISKVKVHYVIHNENKSSSRLLKLKKLSIESTINQTSSAPKNGKLQNSSLILLNQHNHKGNNLLSPAISSSLSKEREAEKLHKLASSATSCGVEQNSTSNNKEDICNSAPPSCYASEGSTGYLSNLSISSSTNCDTIGGDGVFNTKLVQNSSREDSNTTSSESSSSCITKTTIQVPKQNNSEQQTSSSSSSSFTSSSYSSSSSSTSSSLLSNKLADLAKLSSLIEELLEVQRKRRPKRLLIFVNPFGGKGKALHLFKLQVRRLLDLARIESELIVTRHANHARDTIEDPQFNIEYFEGIVCVGGDGMFSELMNGLIFRYNRDRILTAAISGNDGGCDDKLVINDDDAKGEFEQEEARTKESTITTTNRISEKLSKEQRLNNLRKALGGIGKPFLSPPIPIGVIGAGSTDANSFGILGTNDVITATLNIILGNQINIDVCSVHSYERDNLLRFVSTFVGYGYFGDVIRKSEKLRWLGPSRYDITGVNNLIKNRTYKGQVNILSCSKVDGTPFNYNERCHANCEYCGLNSQTGNNGRNKLNNELNDNNDDQIVSNLEYLERRGHFVGVNAAVTACRCPQTKKGFSPNNHLANGCADLILVRPCSRMQYIQYLLRTGWIKKSVFDLKYVEAYRCRQFEFIAQGESSRSRFVDIVDGNDEHFSQYNKQNHNQLNSSSSSTATTMTKSSLSKSSSSSSGVDVGQSSSIKSNSLESRQSSNSNKVFETNTLSSWNIDGEILNEQSIRVKVNNKLLRVFGTGEPKQ